MTIRTGWKLLPGTTTSPSSGPKKVSAKRIRSCPGYAECARRAPMESISFLRAWNKGQPSGSACRSILQKTQPPDPGASAQPLHALLLLHLRSSPGTDRDAGGLILALPGHLLPQWPLLHRAGTRSEQDRLPQER